MQAAVLKNDKEMIVSEVPMPTFGPGQLLIKVNWSSICGTDLHIYLGEFKNRVTYPRILGHEFSGIVESIGKDVYKRLTKGEKMTENKSKYLHKIEDLPRVNLTGDEKLPSMANLLLSDKLLISFIENPPGCVFPVHSHESEQILIMLEGEEEHICGDEKFLMKAGDVCVHPSNVPHGGQTKTGFKGIDIFCPPRPDHVEKLEKALKEQGEK